MPPPPASDPADQAWLSRIHHGYHRRHLGRLDPVHILYDYPDVADREIAGLVASCLAYGNVKAIIAAARTVLSRLGTPVAPRLDHARPADLRRRFTGFRYRFADDRQLVGLLLAVRSARRDFGSLGACFLAGHQPPPQTVLPGVSAFVQALRHRADCELGHLLPHPDDGSACKRLNLYLRWMVRSDEVDPGGWIGVCPSQLIVPLDTHVHRQARRMGWTTRAAADLKAAMEVTAALRRSCPTDPLRYDFAIVRASMANDVAADSPPAPGAVARFTRSGRPPDAR